VAACLGAAVQGACVPQLEGLALTRPDQGGHCSSVGPLCMKVVQEPWLPGPCQVGHVVICERPSQGDGKQGSCWIVQECRWDRRHRYVDGSRAQMQGGANAVHLQRPRFHVDWSSTDTTPMVMCCVVVRHVLPPKYKAAGHLRLMWMHVHSAPGGTGTSGHNQSSTCKLASGAGPRVS
jgi:hypothetical protein